MNAATLNARQETLPLTGRHTGPSAATATKILNELRREIVNGNHAIQRMRRKVENDRRRLQAHNNAKDHAPRPRPTTHWHLCRLPGLEAA